MIEFNQLKHLVAIAKNKTISKAAEELLISQPGLTKSMQRLEEDLGLSLFNRKKNKIELNDNGLLAVEFAKKLLDGREEMIKELTKHNQNYLSFASCAPAPLWGIEYTFQTNTNSQFESYLIQDEQTLIDGLENGDYYVDVKTAGLYDLKVNYSHDCGSDTKAVVMRVDGNTTTQLGEVTLKNTGGWANYQDSDTIEIRLEAGKQFIRIYDDIDGFNYRHVQLTFKGKQDVTQPEITGKDAIVYVDDETDIKDLLELKAIDDIDGDLSNKLTISGDYNCHQAGTYTLTVTVSDQAGNEAIQTFTIKVVEKAKLVIDSKEFIVGDKFDPLTGVKVYDVDGTDITTKLTVVNNNVDPSKEGTYQVIYSVVDALGNEVEFTREVIVKKVKTDVEPSNPDVPSVSKPNDSSSDNQLSSSNGGQETIVGQVVKSTKTGDNTQLVTMMSMLLLAGIGFIVLKRRKYNH